jgi:hypothetical protein
MILELILVALAAAEPNSGVTFKLTSGDLRSMPYIMAYTDCFERAAVDTRTSPVEEAARRFEHCRSARAELVAKHDAQKPSLGRRAERGLEKSFNIIEKAYANALTKRSKRD